MNGDEEWAPNYIKATVNIYLNGEVGENPDHIVSRKIHDTEKPFFIKQFMDDIKNDGYLIVEYRNRTYVLNREVLARCIFTVEYEE